MRGLKFLVATAQPRGPDLILADATPFAAGHGQIVLAPSHALCGGLAEQSTALSSSCDTCPPSQYVKPRFAWADAWPCAAARSNLLMASAGSASIPAPDHVAHCQGHGLRTRIAGFRQRTQQIDGGGVLAWEQAVAEMRW